MKRVKTEDLSYGTLKCFDRTITGTLGTTWDVINSASTMFTPVRGTDIDEREGRRVVIKRMLVRFQIELGEQENATLAALGAELVGLALVLDHQPNGAAPTPTDVFASAEPDAFESLDDMGRYEVLDRLIIPLNRFNLEYVGSEYKTTNTTHIASFDWNTDMLYTFNANNFGSVLDMSDANFFIIGVKTSATTAPVTVTYQGRTYFHDV